MSTKGYFLADLAFFGCLAVVLIISAGGHIVVGDEETMYRLTQNMLVGRGVAVGSENLVIPAQGYDGFIPSKDEILPTTSAIPGNGGRTYSKYGLGQSFAAVPLFLIGSWLAQISGSSIDLPRLIVSFLNALILAGCGILVVLTARLLGFHTRTARWLAVATLFSTFAWPYVKTFYPQPGVAVLLLGAFYSALSWRLTGRRYWLWIFSIIIIALLLFRISEIIALPAFMLYFAIISPKERRWSWVLPMSIGILGGIVLTMAYNWIRFGSVLSTGYNEIAWNMPVWIGLYGLLLSPGKGVLIYTPLLILSLLAWFYFRRRHNEEAWLIAGLWLSFLVFYSPYKYWTGGFNWGPRFLLPLIPLGILPIGEILEGNKTRFAWASFYVLFSLGLFIQLPAIVVDHSRYLYQQVYESGDPNAYSRTIFEGKYSPVVKQWPVVIDLLKLYGKSTTWESAADSLKELAKYGDSLDVQNGRSLLIAEFMRRNSPDLWWLTLDLVRSNPAWYWMILPWMVLGGVSVGLLWWSHVRYTH